MKSKLIIIDEAENVTSEMYENVKELLLPQIDDKPFTIFQFCDKLKLRLTPSQKNRLGAVFNTVHKDQLN